VSEGKGLALVLAVGKNSVFGKIKLKVLQPRDYTPLQIKLRDLAKLIGRISVLAAISTFLVLLLHYLYDYLTTEEPTHELFSLHSLREIVKYFVLGVSIIVVSVPEGLPLSLTMALAYSVQQLRKENNLVRQL
jgi:magnesium-transporting ATPase (P-type)